MSQEDRTERPEEMPAVKTTIVGGRPPGSGKPIGNIPRGMEILIKKAAVDPEFKQLLMEKRAEAATELELELDPAEAAMLNSVPAEQLEAIIANTKVPDPLRRALLGTLVGAALVAAIGALIVPTFVHSRGIQTDHPQTAGISPDESPTLGIRPDYPEQEARDDEQNDASTTKPAPPTRGLTADRPAPTGIRPDHPKDEQ